MADEQRFAVTFSPQQLDFVGKLVVDTLNSASATARMAQEVYALLRGSVTAASGNGVQVPAAAKVVVDATATPSPP